MVGRLGGRAGDQGFVVLVSLMLCALAWVVEHELFGGEVSHSVSARVWAI